MDITCCIISSSNSSWLLHGLTYLMLVTNQDFYTQMLQQEMLEMMQYQLIHIPRSPNFQRSAAGRKPLNPAAPWL